MKSENPLAEGTLLDGAKIPHDDFMARVDAEIIRTRGGEVNKKNISEVAPQPTEKELQRQKIVLDWILSKPVNLPRVDSHARAYTFDEVREKIIASFGIQYFKPNGFSTKRVSCPFHDDKHPDATLHREKGLYCFVCGQTFTWKAIAAKIGIPWEVKATGAIVEETVRGEFIGMSRAERRAFVSAGFTNTARALDILIDRELTGQYFTFRDLVDELGDILKERAIRELFDNLRGKNLPEKEGGELLTDFFHSYDCYLKKVKKTSVIPPHRKTGKPRGKPQEVVRIPTVAEITEASGVLPDVHYGMTLEVISSAPNYRAACMADEIKRRPGKYPRSKIAKPLNISFPTIKAYCDRAGIIRTPTPPKKTPLTPQEIMELPENHAALKTAKNKRGAYMEDERGIRYNLTKSGARRAADAGGGILYRVEYQATDYRPGARKRE